MRFLTCSTAPSPQRVSLYLAEKNIELDTVEIDLGAGQHLTEAFERKSPDCTVPVLELDDGTCLWNTLAIRAWLEEHHPEPPLLGSTPLERARVLQATMWIEHNGFLAAAEAFRNKARSMRDHALPGRRPVAQIPELAERGMMRFERFVDDLDARLADSAWVAGPGFSAADIDAWVVVNFGMRATHLGLDGRDALAAWRERVGARPAFSQQ